MLKLPLRYLMLKSEKYFMLDSETEKSGGDAARSSLDKGREAAAFGHPAKARLLQAAHPLSIFPQREMFDEWKVLRDDQVIRKRWIVCAVAPKLVAAIESSGRRRRDFDDDFRIDDHITVLIQKLKLSAYDQEIRIGVESFLQITTSRQRPASDSHIFCGSLTARASQLRARLQRSG